MEETPVWMKWVPTPTPESEDSTVSDQQPLEPNTMDYELHCVT